MGKICPKKISPHVFEYLNQVESQIGHYVARLDAVPESEIFLPRVLDARLRLLNFRVWSIRYRVEISYLLDLLLQGKFKHVRQHINRKGQLGISSATLCGAASEKYIEETLITSPGYLSRSEEISETMPLREFQYPRTADMVEHYGEVMISRHHESTRMFHHIRCSRRSWRGKWQ